MSKRNDTNAGNEHQQVIISPEIVRGFSSSSITADMGDFLLKILSEWFHEGLRRIYMRTENLNLCEKTG